MHYRAWLVAAHKTMSTASIFSHLVTRARPIFGASSEGKNGFNTPLSNDTELDGSERVATKRQSASAKRRSALTRVITKNNRKRRLNT